MIIPIGKVPVLGPDDAFPEPTVSTRDGIVAIGADLSPARLLCAYSLGIFPWFSEDDPVIWYCPDPRFVLNPCEVKISRSMRKIMSRGEFEIKCDTAFPAVIDECSRKRPDGTWITDDMKNAYNNLHDLGFAHSIEAWDGNFLAGGLYGVSLGKMFFGESMFTRKSNASKSALIALAQSLRRLGFSLIDSQVYTEHVGSMGGVEISRGKYLEILGEALKHETLRGNWKNIVKNTFTA